MRVPLSWLADHVDLPADADELASRLTAAGLKVEAVHRPGAGVEGVVVGEVVAIEPHPRADRLIVAAVRLADGERRIVVGARNFAPGDRVPVAVPGARLPGGAEIVRRPIGGVASEGMLCSARELGVSDDHSGILVLPQSAKVGADVRAVLGLGEVVFELEITPNRPDAMSLLGIAREVAAFAGGEVRAPEAAPREGAAPASALAGVAVEDPAGCPRYLARVIRGVAAGPSPDWVQRRLQAAGVRPVSNVVDATNYALLVTGHPMHAFDQDRLAEGRVVVRRARAGERLTTIDGEDRALDPDDLVIADAARPVALAGVMGGADTEVSGGTVNVLLESAWFDPRSIFRTSKRHGLRTEASARFERGADPNNVAAAADHACRLILDWAGGELAAGAIDVYPSPVEPWRVALRPERANHVLGTSLAAGEMAAALRSLGLEPEMDGGLITVTVTTRRADLRIEEDLIEEVARVAGYDAIPSRLPAGMRSGGLTREQKLLRRVRAVLAGLGVAEAQTSSLLGPAHLERMAYPAGHEALGALRLANALVVDESLLRPSLLPGLAAAVARNAARRNLTVRLFEAGSCFLPSGEVLPREPLRLAIALHGPVPQEWHGPERELDFYDLKGVVETLLDALRTGEARFTPATDAAPLHPGRAAALAVGGRSLGVLGQCGPEAARRLELPHPLLLAELDLAAILELAEPPAEVPEPARFPAVHIDLAVAVPEEVPAADVIAAARGAGGDALEEVRLFDVYRGEQVGEGRKSVALALTFRRPDRTLTDDEAVAARDAIAAAMAESLGAEVRR